MKINKQIDVFQLVSYNKVLPFCVKSSIKEFNINSYKIVKLNKNNNIIEQAINIGCSNPFALVLCSFVLFTKLDFNKKGLPYFIKTISDALDFSCFYVNNCCNWFKKLHYNKTINKIQKQQYYYIIPNEYVTKLKEK